MKSLISVFSLAALVATPLSATEYFFQDFSYRAVDKNSTEWGVTGNLTLSLGKFANGFTPNAGNLAQWGANWIPALDPVWLPDGYYTTDPEWYAYLNLDDNTDFGVGDSLYLWAFDFPTLQTGQWALLTDATWKVVANDPLDPDGQYFGLTGQTSALFGSIASSRVGGIVTTAIAVPVPEPATWIGVCGGALLAVFAVRRRRQRAV